MSLLIVDYNTPVQSIMDKLEHIVIIMEIPREHSRRISPL